MTGYAKGGFIPAGSGGHLPPFDPHGCMSASEAKAYAQANPSLLQQLNERPAMRPRCRFQLGRLGIVPLRAGSKTYRFRGLRIHWFGRERNLTFDVSVMSDERTT